MRTGNCSDPKTGQPQLIVWLSFSLVRSSFDLFPVHVVGLSNTTYEYTDKTSHKTIRVLGREEVTDHDGYRTSDSHMGTTWTEGILPKIETS
jgi:hypothetical protein